MNAKRINTTGNSPEYHENGYSKYADCNVMLYCASYVSTCVALLIGEIYSNDGTEHCYKEFKLSFNSNNPPG